MHTYTFTIKKDIIAVYCLWINEKRVYIGKTNKLKYRLSQHRASCEQDTYNWKKEVNKITYFECKNLTDLDILETYLINEYNPAQNIDKQFGSKSTYKIEIPEEINVIFRQKNKLGFKEVCVKIANNVLAVQDAILLFPKLEYYLKYLEGKDFKRLGYSISKVENEINNSKYTDILNKEIKKLFEKNTFYSSKDVKIKLENLYKELGLNKKAKSSEIENVINIKSTTKSFNNKNIRGYQF